jgi:glycosyltransferase involved in cell wall biosynthesis
VVEPKISVILATYNVGEYISETINSLLAQSFSAHEIIIVNDGSTDDTLEVLKSYKSFSNIVVHNQGNQGVGKAREVGLQKATGDYIFFCDPDDVVSTSLFKEFGQALNKRDGLELFYFSKKSFSGDGEFRKFLRRDTAPSRAGWYEHGIEVLEDLVRGRKYKAAVWQYIFKRSVVSRFDAKFTGRIHEDQLFSIKIYLYSGLCYASCSNLYFQRVRQGSLTNSQKDKDFVWSGYDAYREVLKALLPHVSRFSEARKFALEYIVGRMQFHIDRCVKNNVELPDNIHSLTRKDASDFNLGFYGGIVLISPKASYFMKRSRFKLRVLFRRMRRHQ